MRRKSLITSFEGFVIRISYKGIYWKSCILNLFCGYCCPQCDNENPNGFFLQSVPGFRTTCCQDSQNVTVRNYRITPAGLASAVSFDALTKLRPTAVYKFYKSDFHPSDKGFGDFEDFQMCIRADKFLKKMNFAGSRIWPLLK